LLHCPDEALKKALDRALGDRVDSISVMDLLKEIAMLTLVRQSNHVKTLALMTARRGMSQSASLLPACVAWQQCAT
jgi:hypothetical protein